MYFSSRAKFHECDVLLCPEELSRFGGFDTKRLNEILEIGYSAAMERIESIREALDRAKGTTLPRQSPD